MLSNKPTYNDLLDKISRLETEVQTLKTKNERLTHDIELIIWGTNTAIWDWNYLTGFVKFSEKKAEMLGYLPEEINPSVEAFTSMIHPDDYEAAMDSMRNLLTGKSDVYEIEYRIWAKNGQWKWFYDKGMIAERDIVNKPLRIIGIVNDITDKKNALLEIKETKEKVRKDLLMLHSIFESPVDIIIFSLDRNYCYSSFTKFHKATIKNIWGVEIQLGMNLLEIISNPEDRNKAKINFDRALNGEYLVITEEYGDENLFRTFYENYYCPVKNYENEIVGVSVFVIDVTKRKIIENELIVAKQKIEESEERHKFLFDNTIQGVVYQNTRGEIIFANKSAEKILGFPLNVLQGRKSIDIEWQAIHDDGSEFPGESHPAMISFKTGKPVNDVIMGVFNPIVQDYIWIKINSIPKFLNGEDKPYIVVTTFEDISEIRRKTQELIKAKERVEESEHRFRNLFNNLAVGIRIVDRNGIILEENNSMSKITGIPFEQSVGKPVWDIVYRLTPDNRKTKEVYNQIKKLSIQFIETGNFPNQDKIIENQLQSTDGKIKTVESKFFSVKGEKGFLLYSIVRDITELKSVQKAFKESEEKYKLIAENTSDGILVIDNNNMVQYASTAYLKQMGYTEDEVLRQNSEMIYFQIHPDDRDSLFTNIYNAIKDKKEELIYSFRAKHKNGQYIWREDNAKFNYDNDGNYLRSYVICRDITERKKIEQELINAKEKAEESEQKYKQIFDNTSNYIFILEVTDDQRFKTIALNPTQIKLLKSFNLSNNVGFENNYIDEFLSTEVFNHVKSNYIRCITKKRRINYEEEIYDQFFQTQLIPIKNKSGIVHRIIGISNNITENRRLTNKLINQNEKLKYMNFDLLVAKEKAEKSENLFRIFIEHSSSGETLHDTSGKLLIGSPSVEKITGYSIEDFISEKITLMDICAYDEKAHCRYIFTEAIKGRNFSDIPIKALTPAKVIKYLNVTINQIFLENSERYGFRISITDVTEKIEAEKLSKSLLKAVESTQASVFILNTKFEIEYINPFFSTHTGYVQEDIIGKKYTAFHSNIQQNDNYYSIYQVLGKGSTWEGEIIKEKKDTTTFVEQVTISPIKNEQNNTTHFVGVGTDITFLKELDKKIVQTIVQTEESERKRFARDLHDGIGPILSIAKLYVQSLSNPDSKMSNTEIGLSVEELLLEAQKNVRKISYNLSPLILQTFGLIEAIKSFTYKLEESSEIKTNIQSNWRKRLNSMEETILYRVLCECINNTIKHASATEIQLAFFQHTDTMDITYFDNGKGFDYKDVVRHKTGTGFLNIQSRLKIINATFDVQSSPNSGTKIIICINNN
jgi:PAS domain S-box-containing protein